MLSLAYRLGLSVCVVLAILCGAVRAFGARPYTDDPDWTAFGFAACALPCWAGITPGETEFPQAYDLLLKHVPGLRTRVLLNGVQINFTAQSDRQPAGGLVSNVQGFADIITLSLQLPLGQLVSRLGTPDCYFNTPNAPDPWGEMTVVWQMDHTVLTANLARSTEAVGLSTPIQSLVLRTANAICAEDDALPWIGFAPRWRYPHYARVY